MRRVEKKAWPEWFQKVADGVKTYDLRLADFDIGPGDVLVLREWDPLTKKYTGREIEKVVTYVGRTKDNSPWPKKDVDKYGFQVIAFK